MVSAYMHGSAERLFRDADDRLKKFEAHPNSHSENIMLFTVLKTIKDYSLSVQYLDHIAQKRSGWFASPEEIPKYIIKHFGVDITRIYESMETKMEEVIYTATVPPTYVPPITKDGRLLIISPANKYKANWILDIIMRKLDEQREGLPLREQ